MNFRAPSPSEAGFQPHSPDEHDATGYVVDSINALGLERDQLQDVVLVGSAALAVYGVELPRYEGKARPGDVDFVATTSLMESLYGAGETPGGVRIARKEDYIGPQTILRANPTNFLAADFISSYRGGDPAKYDQRLRNFNQKNSSFVPGTNIQIATPERLIREIKTHRFDPKYKADLLQAQAAIHAAVRSYRRSA